MCGRDAAGSIHVWCIGGSDSGLLWSRLNLYVRLSSAVRQRKRACLRWRTPVSAQMRAHGAGAGPPRDVTC